MGKIFIKTIFLFCSIFIFASEGKESFCLVSTQEQSSVLREIVESLCLHIGVTEFSLNNAALGLKKMERRMENLGDLIHYLKQEEKNRVWIDAIKKIKKTAKEGVQKAGKEHRRERRELCHKVSKNNIRIAMKAAAIAAKSDEELAQKIAELKTSSDKKIIDFQDIIQIKQNQLDEQNAELAKQKEKLIELRDALTIARQFSNMKDEEILNLKTNFEKSRSEVQKLEELLSSRQNSTKEGSGAIVASVFSKVANFFT